MMRDMVENYYLEKDYNCAETTLHIINDTYHLGLSEEDFKLVGAYGGGFGCGITCGALAGAMAALGKLTICQRAHATDGFRDLCGAYVEAFKEKLHNTNCDAIKEEFFLDEERRCLRTVQLAADLFEEFAAQHGIQPLPEEEAKK